MGVNKRERERERERKKREESYKMNREKLMKMAGAVRTGGKGSVRRKKKAAHKATTTDDKRLQTTLKRIGVNNIPGIEEVNIFKANEVVHFINPKVQASIQANTYVVSGTPVTKSLQELLPGIINQLGPDSVPYIQKIAGQYQSGINATAAANTSAGAAETIKEEGVGKEEEDEDDVPDLVDTNFEDVSKQDE